MSWQPASANQGSAAAAMATAAAAFLVGVIHDEVDGAQIIGPVTVLARENRDAAGGAALYILAVVRGPVRCYLATAWGPAGHPHDHRIVSYPTMEEAQGALRDLVAQRTAPTGAPAGYHTLGLYTPS